MRVFSLPSHTIRNGRTASLEPRSAAGPSVEPRSRHRMRKPRRLRGLVLAVEWLRLDHPMWGKPKLGPIPRKQGFAAGDATVGRIAGELIRRGAVAKVPALIRKAAARPAPATSCKSTRSPSRPLPDAPSNTSTPAIRRPNGPSRDLTDGHREKRRRLPRPRSSPQCRTPSKPSRSTADRSSWPSSRQPAPQRKPHSMFCRMFWRRDRPSSMGVECCNGVWRYEFHAGTAPSNRQNRRPCRGLPAPQQSPKTARSPCRKNPSLICREPGHLLARHRFDI